jgi:RNA polymerase sigma-70 factor (ECF subfamily)
MIMKLKEGSELAVKLRDFNDKESMSLLFKKYYPLLKYFINKKFKDIPEKHHHDIAIESILKSFEKIDTFDEDKSNYKTWLFAIAYNNCLLFLKRDTELNKEFLVENESFDVFGQNKSISGKTHINIIKSTDIYESDSHPLDQSQDFLNFSYDEIEERSNHIKNLIEELPSEKLLKDIAVAYLIEDTPLKEMYDIYDMPEGTMKSRIRLIKKKLSSKYSVQYPKDINKRKNSIDSERRRSLRKEKNDKYLKIISEIDLQKEVELLDIDEIKKNVFIEYIINDNSRLKVKEMFNLKHVDKVNSYCGYVKDKILLKFDEIN